MAMSKLRYKVRYKWFNSNLMILILIICFISIGGLIILLNKLLNKQLKDSLDQFADKAMIPNSLRERIKLKIKWNKL